MSDESLLGAVTAARHAYPTPMSPDQLGALLNAVAWAHRDAGWGLLRKSSGNHVPQPKTGILVAADILFNRNSLHHYDVLHASGETADPIWSDDGPNDPALWVEPVEPDAVPAKPPATPPPSKPASTPYTKALEDVKNAMVLMESRQQAMQAQLDAIATAAQQRTYSAPLFGFGTLVLKPSDQPK